MSLFGKPRLPLNEETARLFTFEVADGRLREFAKAHALTLAHFLLKNPKGVTPFYEAACHGQLDEVAEILKASREGLRREHFLMQAPSDTALHQAVWNNQLGVVTDALKASGETLRRDDFLLRNGSGITPLYWAAGRGRLEQVLEILKPTGEKFTAEHFLTFETRARSEHTPLEAAAAYGHLSQIFIPSYWAARVGEMEKLWQQVPEKDRPQIDYEALRNEAIAQSVTAAPRWSPIDFKEVKRRNGTSESENQPEKAK